MRKEEFRTWLSVSKGAQKSTANSRVSNCQRIEEFEGDLDKLFTQDKLKGLIERLQYSKQDQQKNKLPRHKVPIAGDSYTGTATLRSAAKLYQEFSSGVISTKREPNVRSYKKLIKTSRNWPTWEQPTAEAVLTITRMVTPYVRFLHPNIVKQVVEDNERNRFQWCAKLSSRRIDPEYYLWDKSSCSFPGIRRYAGSKEIAYYRKQIGKESMRISDAFRLDDNSFPKHLWSFIFREKVFQNFGPEGYSLAHLADHKEYKNRRDDEFEFYGEAPKNLHGLFTCASNTVYMPNSLLRLTDFTMQARLLLLHKAQSLYGSFCNILPPPFSLKLQALHDWNADNFDWGELVGEDIELDNFFLYRAEVINSL